MTGESKGFRGSIVGHMRGSQRGTTSLLKSDNRICSAILALLSGAVLFFAFFSADNRRVENKADVGFFCLDESLRGVSWTQQELKDSIFEFLKLYQTRPLGRKAGGMLFEHSFYFWWTLQKLQPKYVIESGVFEGHSTWLIKQTLPNARVFSLDPNAADALFDGVDYFRANNFTDFALMDWDKLIPMDERKDALVFFDDHQSGFRRVLEAMTLGFRRIILEDNYASAGDNYSMRKVCDQKQLISLFTDNFKKRSHQINDSVRKLHAAIFKSTVDVYYEFPPVADVTFTHSKRHDSSNTASPLLVSPQDASAYLALEDVVTVEFLSMYTHFALIILKDL